MMVKSEMVPVSISHSDWVRVDISEDKISSLLHSYTIRVYYFVFFSYFLVVHLTLTVIFKPVAIQIHRLIQTDAIQFFEDIVLTVNTVSEELFPIQDVDNLLFRYTILL